jgi:hypothetical protein
VLKGLWRHIAEVMVLEFKSLARPLRRGDLARLQGYAFLYVADERRGRVEAVSLALVVASVTPTLEAELRAQGLSLPEREGGYAALKVGAFKLILAVVDEVAEAERDELLGAFGHGELHRLGDRLWWEKELGRTMSTLKALPGHDRVLKKLLAAIPPKQRLAGLAPEQRLAGLQGEEALQAIEAALDRLPKDVATSLRVMLQARRNHPPRRPRRRSEKATSRRHHPSTRRH